MDDLIERARAGDSDAFITVFEWHKQALWKTAMAVLGNPDDAADVLQETVIKGWKAIPHFEGRSGIGTWLTRILLHACSDMLRQHKRETPFAGDAIDNKESLDGAGGRTVSGEGRILYINRKEADVDQHIDVEQALHGLHRDDRLILSLFYVNDYPVKQIAHILEITEGAVRTRLTRARSRFKALYENEGAIAVGVSR